MTTYKRLTDQVAWISGAASGMGKAIALRYAAEGACVALIDIQADACESLAEQINSLYPKSSPVAVSLPADVADEQQVLAGIQQTVDTFGGLSIVVNCAGIVEVVSLEDSTAEQWNRLMAINLNSIFFSVKYALPHLRKSKRSYVVNIGSIGSLQGQAGTPAYTTSKHAVLGLTRSIALDHAVDGVRCNCICPGITDTPMFRFHMSQAPDPEQAIADRLNKVPMGIAMQPDDIARAAVYFACEDSSGITGTNLVIDGGYTATVEWKNTRPTPFQED